MALTRSEQPNLWSAVYAPVIYQFTSNFGEYYRLAPVLTTTIFTNTNGYLQVEFTTQHNLQAGDYFFANGDNPRPLRVTSVPTPFVVILNVAFDVTDVFATGWHYAYQYNASVRVWGKIEGVYQDIGIITNKPVWNGTEYVFTFDVAPILRSYITSDLPSLTAETTQEADQSTLEYYVEFREEYTRGVDGESIYYKFSFEPDTDTDYYDLNYKIANNACEQYDEQPDSTYKQEAYVFDGSTAGRKFLTNQPTLPYCDGDDIALHVNSEALTGVNMRVRQYNGAGTLIQTDSWAIGNLQFGQNIVHLDTSQFAFADAARTFCISIEYSGVYSEELCYKIEQNCCSTTYRLVWLNDKGGYSQFYFNGKASKGIDVDRVQPIKYNLYLSRFKPANRQYGNLLNVPRETLVYTNETSDRTVHEWLVQEVLSSIDVYIVEEIDDIERFIPVVVDANSGAISRDGDKRYSFAVPLIKGFNRTVQTR